MKCVLWRTKKLTRFLRGYCRNLNDYPVIIPLFLCSFLHQIALLKLLLAAAPTSKAKTDSINILADVLPEEMP